MIPRSGNYLVDMWEDEEDAQAQRLKERKKCGIYGQEDAKFGWDEANEPGY